MEVRKLLIGGRTCGVLITLTLSALVASGCTATPEGEVGSDGVQHGWIASGLDESWLRAFELLDRYALQQAEDWATPGVSLALTDADRLLGVRTYGFANLDARTPVGPNTMFIMGSIGKSFTAAALLQEHEHGTIDLHAPVRDYLPWFAVGSGGDPVTIHELLTHTAGIVTGTDLAPHGHYESWALRNSRRATGPHGFHYSNVGYKTLGLLLEAVRDEPLGDILESGILEPLGMIATHGAITDETRRLSAVAYESLQDDRPVLPGGPLVPAGWHEYAAGDGSVASTPADMAAYVRMLLNRGAGPDGRILSEESFALFTAESAEFAPGLHYGYGLDVKTVDGRTVVSHGGGHLSFVSHITADLDTGFGAVVMMNSGGPASEVTQFMLDLAVAVDRGDELPELPDRLDRQRIDSAEDYVGAYRSDAREVAVGAEGDRLYLEVESARIPLLSLVPDAFVVDHPDFALFPLVFTRQDGDIVEAFHGAEWFRHERYDGPEQFELPESRAPFVGHYRSHNPWLTNFRVLARKGALYLVYPWGAAQRLHPLEDGLFAVADEGAAETIRFGAVASGKALSARLAGGDYYRAFRRQQPRSAGPGSQDDGHD